jgi:hypothetical protein
MKAATYIRFLSDVMHWWLFDFRLLLSHFLLRLFCILILDKSGLGDNKGLPWADFVTMKISVNVRVFIHIVRCLPEGFFIFLNLRQAMGSQISIRSSQLASPLIPFASPMATITVAIVSTLCLTTGVPIGTFPTIECPFITVGRLCATVCKKLRRVAQCQHAASHQL